MRGRVRQEAESARGSEVINELIYHYLSPRVFLPSSTWYSILTPFLMRNCLRQEAESVRGSRICDRKPNLRQAAESEQAESTIGWPTETSVPLFISFIFLYFFIFFHQHTSIETSFPRRLSINNRTEQHSNLQILIDDITSQLPGTLNTLFFPFYSFY